MDLKNKIKIGYFADGPWSHLAFERLISDSTIETALCNLVEGMKSDGIWTKMKAIYPFVGGTADTHKYNLKDPRDLDAAFRITWAGGVTHASTGVKGNGTSGYGDTKWAASVHLGNGTGVSFGYYSRNVQTVGGDYMMGAAAAAGSNTWIIERPSNSNSYYFALVQSNLLLLHPHWQVSLGLKIFFYH